MQDRLKLFIWKMCNNILPTRTLIHKVIPLQDEQLVFPLCNIEAKDLLHLFLNYLYSKIMWRHSNCPIDSTLFASKPIKSWIQTILNLIFILKIPEEEHHDFQIFAAIVMDSIWFFRNKVIHDQVKCSPSIFIKSVEKSFQEHKRGLVNVD